MVLKNQEFKFLNIFLIWVLMNSAIYGHSQNLNQTSFINLKNLNSLKYTRGENSKITKGNCIKINPSISEELENFVKSDSNYKILELITTDSTYAICLIKEWCYCYEYNFLILVTQNGIKSFDRRSVKRKFRTIKKYLRNDQSLNWRTKKNLIKRIRNLRNQKFCVNDIGGHKNSIW